jgi:hypothetical protein
LFLCVNISRFSICSIFIDMKILVTENQYFKLILEQQTEIDFPDEIVVGFTNFKPDTNHQRTFVYINGVTPEDKKTIKELKDGGENVVVKLKNTSTNEVIDFSINEINLTKSSGALYITMDKYLTTKDALISGDRSLSYLFKYDKSENTYQKTLRKLLQTIYSTKTDINGEPMYGESVKDENCKTNRGVINYRGVKYGADFSLVSDWSILNYFDTNSEVISRLLDIYSAKTKKSLEGEKDNFEDFKVRFLNWLVANGEEILGPKSIFLDGLQELNWNTLKTGITNEQNGINVIKQIHDIEEGGLTEYCPGSVQDTRYGRDLKVNDENLYYQIKPLKGNVKFSTVEGFKYAVPTRSMKKYNPNYVDRIMFINDDGSKYVIFENKDYEVVDKGRLTIFKNEPLYIG